MSINELQDEVITEFSDFDDWMDRYQLLIDLGNEQEPLDEKYKTEQNLITVLEAGPCVVTQIKTVENDGYSAVQVGFGDKKEKVVEKDANGKKSVAHRHGVNKAQMGHFKKAGVSGKRFVREFKFENADEYNLADEIKADIFAEGDKVDVTAISKGKVSRVLSRDYFALFTRFCSLFYCNESFLSSWNCALD